MTRLASAIVALGVRLLPQQDRRRYAEEFDADLRSQPGWRRLGYAVSIVLAAPRLRWELLTRLAMQPAPYCYLAMHRDRTTHPNREDGRIIARECVICHRVRDPRQYPGTSHPEGMSWVSARQL